MANDRAVHPSHRIVHLSLLVSAVALVAVVPACSSSSSPTAVAPTTASATSTTVTVPTSATVPDQAAAQIATCTATAKVVDVALAAYQAEKGAYPSTVPWSAATYATNYAALTASGGGGGPFMSRAPLTTAFVIEFDSTGHVWVSPPGFYGPYDEGQDIDASPDACDAAVG